MGGLEFTYPQGKAPKQGATAEAAVETLSEWLRVNGAKFNSKELQAVVQSVFEECKKQPLRALGVRYALYTFIEKYLPDFVPRMVRIASLLGSRGTLQHSSLTTFVVFRTRRLWRRSSSRTRR